MLFCLQEYQSKFKIISIVKPQEAINDDDYQTKKILVHIVCDNDSGEQFWVKIIARNNDAINDELESCEFGHKNVLEQADDFLKLANNTRCFRPPKVIFDFLHQMNEDLEVALEEKGVISGRKFRAGSSNCNSLDSNNLLNIDITTMIAYVSELSNGGGLDIVFNDKFLDMQAEEERVNPVLKVINKIIEGKKLIACETAVNSFKEIINILGGQKERKRADEFLATIEVLPDIEDVNQVIKNVELTSHIKERSRKIFAFGIYHSAITVTSNYGFARAIKMKNLEIPMMFHNARALTEMKETLIKSTIRLSWFNSRLM